MAKHAALAFNRQLDGLFHQRTYRLRSLVSKPGRGRTPELNRAKITRGIRQLQQLASNCLATQYARREFDTTVDQHKKWQITASKGRGWREKQRAFGKWYANKIDHRNCIYVFWQRSNGADAPIVRCNSVTPTRGSFMAVRPLRWPTALAMALNLKRGEVN